MALRSRQAAMDLQEKFLTKKRRRIELLQSQSKDVALSKLSVGQFSALLSTKGNTGEDDVGQQQTDAQKNLLIKNTTTANIPEQLMKTQGGSLAAAGGDKMEVDQAVESKFSHEVKPSSLTGSTNTADKIKQRNKLLAEYASKELAAAQQNQGQ